MLQCGAGPRTSIAPLRNCTGAPPRIWSLWVPPIRFFDQLGRRNQNGRRGELGGRSAFRVPVCGSETSLNRRVRLRRSPPLRPPSPADRRRSRPSRHRHRRLRMPPRRLRLADAEIVEFLGGVAAFPISGGPAGGRQDGALFLRRGVIKNSFRRWPSLSIATPDGGIADAHMARHCVARMLRQHARVGGSCADIGRRPRQLAEVTEAGAGARSLHFCGRRGCRISRR
jgi:hypothetical protein